MSNIQSEGAQPEPGEPSTGVYLYAVVPEPPAVDLGDGIEKHHVYTIDENSLKVVVSDLEVQKELRPERRNLAAHQAVLSRLLDTSPAVLPFSFGTVADGVEGVKKLLATHHQELIDQIQHLRGKTEVTVRLTYTAESPSMFEHLLAQHPELVQQRDQLFGPESTATRDEKIDFGKAVEAALTDIREAYGRQIEEALAGHVDDVKHLPCRKDNELARLACLVDKSSVGGLESMVQEAGKRFDEHFALEYAGPFPPFDFALLHFKVPDADLG
jgi:Gas vesicle synthesis protein GvpL/GvpF